MYTRYAISQDKPTCVIVIKYCLIDSCQNLSLRNGLQDEIIINRFLWSVRIYGAFRRIRTTKYRTTYYHEENYKFGLQVYCTTM